MSEIVPSFDERGLLPPGNYEVTFGQLRNSVLVEGTETYKLDSVWRHYLIGRAEVLIKQLWQVGITNVFLNGSFVEAKAHPNDIDGYFEVELRRFASGELERELNALDPNKAWTWDHAARKRYRNYAKAQLPMWHHYRVELYPHYPGLVALQDRHGNNLQFPAAFRTQRTTDEPKGIIKIVKGDAP